MWRQLAVWFQTRESVPACYSLFVQYLSQEYDRQQQDNCESLDRCPILSPSLEAMILKNLRTRLERTKYVSLINCNRLLLFHLSRAQCMMVVDNKNKFRLWRSLVKSKTGFLTNKIASENNHVTFAWILFDITHANFTKRRLNGISLNVTVSLPYFSKCKTRKNQ